MKKFLILLYLFLLSIFIFLSSGVIDSQDGFQYLAVARNIYYTGRPTAPIYEYTQLKNIHLSTYVGKDGNTYSPTGLGYSLAFVPAVAITDLFYKAYNVSPPVHFPLESDWLILLFSSFTNAFFGAGLGVILFLYLLEFKLSKKQSLAVVFISLFATNLLIYTKDAFAQMMFTTFLVLSFFLIKKYFSKKTMKFLFFSGLSYGLVSLTYNLTWVLTLPPLVLYYFLLFRENKSKLKLKDFMKVVLKDGLIFFVGFLPFLIIGLWFEQIRALGGVNQSSFYYGSYASKVVSGLKPAVLYEGIFGQLFSPGRSVFLYSPILLLIIIFWTKIKKIVQSELIIFIFMSAIFVLFYASQFTTGRPDQGIAGLWHGESSWGPRYLLPAIPFGMLVIGVIIKNLSKFQKLYVLLPLVLFGAYIEVLGVVVPYQDKSHNLQDHFFVNQTEYTSYVYSNLLPRFSPIITMPKELITMVKTIPRSLNNGKYNVHFHDGIDFPFNVGPERWRVIKETGYVNFDNKPNKVSKISIGFINQPISESSHSAVLSFELNNQKISADSTTLAVSERKTFNILIDPEFLKPTGNELNIHTSYDNQSVSSSSSQITAMTSFSVNDTPVNIESLEFPYVSPLGPKMTGVTYRNFGGVLNSPWVSWDIHTQIYERIPDFWWFKAVYYWDFPKKQILIFAVLNILLIIYFGNKIRAHLRD